MFSRILIPLDGSEAAESVLLYATELSRTFGSQVDVVGVCTEPENGLWRIYRVYLEKMASDLQERGVKAKAVLLRGAPSDEILSYIEQNNIDLVAMTIYGRSGVKRWLVGSVANQIMRVVTIPALFVPPGQLSGKLAIKKILVPLDESEAGKAALPYVEGIAQKMKSSVVLLHAVAPLAPMVVGVVDTDISLVASLEEKSKEHARDYLGGLANEFAKKGIKTESEVVFGDPAAVILDYAENKNVDLIAMPTLGRGGFARWLLGSISHKVLTASNKPVLMVRGIQPE